MENQSQQPNPVNPSAPPVCAPRPQPDAAQIANNVAAMAGNYVSLMNTGLLPVVESIKQAITIEVINAASLIVASILYVLTISLASYSCLLIQVSKVLKLYKLEG